MGVVISVLFLETKGTISGDFGIADENELVDTFSMETLPPLLQLEIVNQLSDDVIVEFGCCSQYWNLVMSNYLTPAKLHRIALYERKDWAQTRRGYEIIRRDDEDVIFWRPQASFKLRRLQEKGFKVQAQLLKMKCSLTSKVCQRAIQRFRRFETTADTFYIKTAKRQLDCTKHELGTLLSILQCKSFQVGSFISRRYLSLSEIRKMELISLANSDITDEQLLGFSATRIHISANTVSNAGIIQFMQNCIDGSHKFYHFYITFDQQPERAMEIANHFGAERFWTQERHKSSALAAFLMEDFDDEDLLSAYVINSTNDIPFYILVTPEGTLLADSQAYNSEEDILAMGTLTKEQLYLVRNICPFCQKILFCEHFQRFSVGRLRRNCPLIFKTLSFLSILVKYAGTFVGILNNIPNLDVFVNAVVEHRTWLCQLLNCVHLHDIE